jgi:methenyltetrahydrofolate cyclohydrolase
MTLEETLERLAAAAPAPGAGAASAWCCALAAALVEMVARVALAGGDDNPGMERRRTRAAELRADTLRLAEEDAAAYRAAMNAPPERRAEAFAAAADPPLAIAEAAVEARGLASALEGEVRGPVVGEARAAVHLAGAAARAAAGLVELNLADIPEDARLARARAIAEQVTAP